MGRRRRGLGALLLVAVAVTVAPRTEAAEREGSVPLLPNYPDRPVTWQEFNQYVALSGSNLLNELSDRDASELPASLCGARSTTDVDAVFQRAWPPYLALTYPSQSAAVRLALLKTLSCREGMPPQEVLDWARAWAILRMSNSQISLQRILGKNHADGLCKLLDDSESVTGPILGAAADEVGLSGDLVSAGLSVAVVFCPTVLGWFD